MSGYPGPQVHPNPTLRDAVRASGLPGWQIAIAAGIIHYTKFSELINRDSVPATRTNIERLRRIATVIGFPVEHLFADGGGNR